MVKKISEKEFLEVKEQDIALVDFSATWCGPCKKLAPMLDEISNQMGDKVAFYNVDVDENQKLALQYGIASIPSLLIMKKGEKVDMKVGVAPKDEIIAFITAHM